MSKSLGNVIAPQDVMKQHGADILRLWVVGSDYSEDLRIGAGDPEAPGRRLSPAAQHAALSAGHPRRLHARPSGCRRAQMPELERWVLHRLAELDGVVRRGIDDFDFHSLFTALHNFCAVDLSAFYFDIRKDALYCDRPDSPRRRAARTVLDAAVRLPDRLAGADPAASPPRRPGSPGIRRAEAQRPSAGSSRTSPAAWRDEALARALGARPRGLRRVVTGALELERAREAHRLEPAGGADGLRRRRPTWPALRRTSTSPSSCITAAIELIEAAAAAGRLHPRRRAGRRRGARRWRRATNAQRCWQVLPEVGADPAAPDLCRRCPMRSTPLAAA